MKFLWLWIVLGVIAIIAIIISLLPKTKKRYLSYILHHASSLIARYNV